MPRTFNHVLLLVAFSAASAATPDLHEELHRAQSSGKFAEAASLLRQLIAEGENTAAQHSNLAAMLHFAGYDREALAEARIALKRDPGLSKASLVAGMSLLRMGDAKAALVYLDRAHREMPSDVVPVLGLARAYLSLRDYHNANALFREGARLDPKNPETWFGAGITFRSLADEAIKKAPLGETPPEAVRFLQAALPALTKAVELDPESTRTHLVLAESYRDSGKLLDAVKEYQIVFRNHPGDPAANLGLATAYWKAGELDNALPALQIVLNATPGDPEANGIMAAILVRRGAFAQAGIHAKRALQVNPNLPQVRFALAKVYLEDNNPEAAVAELRKIAPRDPDGSYHFLLHRALKSLGRDQEAAAALDEFKRRRSVSDSANESLP